MLELTDEELLALGEDRRLQAIKMVRERTSLGLVEAVSFLDNQGIKAGLVQDVPLKGDQRLRPLRQNPDITPGSFLAPSSPEAKYLREWAGFYEDKAKGALYTLPPTGVDPMKAGKALAVLRAIDGVLFDNTIKSAKEKVARVDRIIMDAREVLL